jgi:hypothetical protein
VSSFAAQRFSQGFRIWWFQWLKRKSEHVDKSSSKKAKTQLVCSKRPLAMLQSALYAVEWMSHAIWISHTINLVIIGELFMATFCP